MEGFQRSQQLIDAEIARTLVPRCLAHLSIYTWAWFLMPMTTLSLSTLLDAQRQIFDFNGLYAIGVVVYIIGLVEFVFLFAARLITFCLYKDSLWRSLQEPSEAMFFATFWISIYGIISGGVVFASPNPNTSLAEAFHAFFWIYLICALLAGMGLHLLIFHKRHLEERNMTPAWLLPVLPIILIGVSAGDVVLSLNQTQSCPVLVAGLLCASMGFLLSLPMAALYLNRLFISGFPDPDTRPGMMIAVGPPTYAPLAYLKMAKTLSNNYACFGAQLYAVEVIQAFTLFFAIGIFGMAVFFLFMGLCANVRRAKSMKFHLTWYGFVFPNVGLLSTMGIIAQELSSDAVKSVTSAGTAILSVVWVFVTLMHLRSILKRLTAADGQN